MTDERIFVDDSEMVNRLLSVPGCVRYGKLSPTAFSLYHRNEDYVSVLRSKFLESEKELLEIGLRIKRWPEKNDVFYGYCTLKVGDIRAISKQLQVESYYEEKFKAHAGIVFYDNQGSKIVNTGEGLFPPELLLFQLELCRIARNTVRLTCN